ncbi:TetR/AcrR family transcriptional regulator [Gracilimonas mengyeensis]|nr:TetR/AcrR family transcriptional regulator [Gracilimonas mengyeensis]
MARTKEFDEQEVLTKAMTLFWKQGYAATSVQDLVSHLGINRASLYSTFGDKEKLFKKAFEHYHRSNFERVNQFFQNHPDPKEGFNKLFEMAVDESVNDQDMKGCFAVNTTTELVPGNKEMQMVLKGNRKQVENLFYDYLKKGQEAGHITTDKNLKSLAFLLFTFYNGLRVVCKTEPDREELMQSVYTELSLLD